MRKVLEASHAVSEAVKLADPDVIAAYPITPQTHIVEELSRMKADGEISSEYIRVESEFTAISAVAGASAAGSRAYTATASQGLALMHEMLFVVSGMRLPVVMNVANRALSAPINIWNDHQDAMSARDCGWLQFYAETAQEILDLTLMAFRVAEDKDVLLPIMVNLDGFTLSHVYEPVDIPDKQTVAKFLPKYKPVHAYVDPERPTTQGPIGFPSHFMELRADQVKAVEQSAQIIKTVFAEFKNIFGREYSFVEEYRTEDAEIVLVGLGSECGTVKVVIDELRDKGEKVGLLKLTVYRPFPKEEIKRALDGIDKVAVLDKAVSPGADNVLFTDMKATLYRHSHTPELRNFVVGLGGRDITYDHIRKIYYMMKNGEGSEVEWMF